jgi:hypothetical protein
MRGTETLFVTLIGHRLKNSILFFCNTKMTIENVFYIRYLNISFLRDCDQTDNTPDHVWRLRCRLTTWNVDISVSHQSNHDLDFKCPGHRPILRDWSLDKKITYTLKMCYFWNVVEMFILLLVILNLPAYG